MASNSLASASLFLAVNILFFSLVSATATNCPPPPKPKPTCPPPPKPKPACPPPPKSNPTPTIPKTPTVPSPSIPKTPPVPTPSVPKSPSVPTPSVPKTPPVLSPTTPPMGSCPRDTLKLGVCGNLLGGVVGVVLGTPSESPCCTLLQGLTDLDAAVCLCTAIKANILGINLNVPISLSLLLNACGYKDTSGFKCE